MPENPTSDQPFDEENEHDPALPEALSPLGGELEDFHDEETDHAQPEDESEEIAWELGDAEAPEEDLTDQFAVESVYAEIRGRAPEHQMAPRLDAMQLAMDFLGDPAHSAPVLHITGTNGKTSTARMVERLLLAHGLRTGRYTSPHLERVNERISIDGEPVANGTFVRIWDEIRPYLVMVDQRLEAAGAVRLTEFEAMTVLAFAVFADEPVDVMVLEVGLGGAWDATNVADAQVSVITPIDLDHTEMLGETREEIAQEKAGIIAQDGFLVSAAQRPEVAEVLLAAARAQQAQFRFEGVEFGVTERTPGVGGQLISVRGLAGEYTGIALPVHGEHQAQNASVALAAVEAFLGGGTTALDQDLVRTAFEDLTTPGRLELVHSAPAVILDAAHNPHGLLASAHAVKEAFDVRELGIVFGALQEKDVAAMLEVLWAQYGESREFETKLFVTQSSSPRAVPAELLAELAVEAGFDEDDVEAHLGLDDAVAAAVSEAGQHEDLGSAVLVTGSVTVVGEARVLIGSEG